MKGRYARSQECAQVPCMPKESLGKMVTSNTKCLLNLLNSQIFGNFWKIFGRNQIFLVENVNAMSQDVPVMPKEFR